VKLTARGFRIESQTRGSIAPQVLRLRVPGGVSVAQARQTVHQVDARASADFDHFYYPDGSMIPCTGPDCMATSLIGWAASDASHCGPIPVIGLIDTGINLEHEALKGQKIEVLAGSASQANASLQDHGTAVAALLVGRPESQTPGLLPGAKLIAVDAFYRDSGSADRTDVMSLVAAMEKLADRGVRVMNLSLSGPPNAVLQKAIEAAQAKGIVIVAAAGNNGPGAEPSYPAAYPGVIAVTAVDQQYRVYRRATHGTYVDLAAPGVGVWTASAKGGGALKTGTSFAVPFASAAAGLLIASHPELDARAVEARLEESTQDLGEPGRDPMFGFGLIQMAGLCARPSAPQLMTTAQEKPVASSVLGETSGVR
jgi:phosphoheptose isomerase